MFLGSKGIFFQTRIVDLFRAAVDLAGDSLPVFHRIHPGCRDGWGGKACHGSRVGNKHLSS